MAGLPLPRGILSQQEKPFSHRGRAVTKKERDVARENTGRRELSDEPFLSCVGLSGFFEFSDSLNIVALG